VIQTYRVLARQYRPKVISELIGQDALVRILKNAFQSNRIPHAIMLSGARGVGKTTTARLLARALNCIGNGPDSAPTLTPCGQCDPCQKILADGHVDILEMDAASRTGVDDIRDIVEGVKYKPVSARYKIYIIDEVHMLSKSAFNALLKTLEEPPTHAKFIFATTEIRKVPVTILSRCMRFDLRLVETSVLSNHLQHIAKLEKIEIDPKAALLLAQAASGSVRDGLSLLDQAIVYAEGSISFEQVQTMLGVLDRSQLYDLLNDVLKGDIKNALQRSEKAYQDGADPLQILHDLQSILYILSRALIQPDYLNEPHVLEFDRVNAAKLLPSLSMPLLMRAWQMTQKGIEEMSFALDAYRCLELILIRLAYVADLPTPNAVIEHLQNIAPQKQEEAPRIIAQPRPETFQDIVTLCQDQKEMILAMQLTDQMIPIETCFGKLKISLKETAPKDLSLKLAKFLNDTTNKNWDIEIIERQSGSTLYELDQKRKEKELDELKKNPLMAETLDQFKDASITKIEKILD
jgi:DNA polymerase-3 subunit gamma/tau